MWKYQIKERMITTSSPPEETLRCQDHDSRRTGYEMPHGYAACGLAVWFILSDLLNCTVEYPAPPRPETIRHRSLVRANTIPIAGQRI